MKKISALSLIITLILVSGIMAQQTQQVIPLPGIAKDVLFTRSLNWLATDFVSSKAIIDMQDKAQGKIIGNIMVPYRIIFAPVSMHTKLIIEVQKDKARLTLIPIEVNMAPSNVGTRSFRDDDVSRVAEEYQNIIKKYQEFVSKKEDAW
jgi:hypothetical protein